MQRGIDWLHVCLKSLYTGITFDYLLMRAVPSANFYLSSYLPLHRASQIRLKRPILPSLGALLTSWSKQPN